MQKLFIAWLLIPFITQAQNTWSMERCVRHIEENNTAVQQANISIELAKINYEQSKYNLLPTLNAGISNALNFGRSVDQTTYQFVNKTIQSTGINVSTNATIFNGFIRQNQIKQNSLQVQSAEYDVRKLKNDLSLNVANLYLNILLLKQQILLAENQGNILQQQRQRTQRLIDAGALATSTIVDFETQQSQNELAIVNVKIQLDNAKNAMKQVLQLPLTQDFDVEAIEVEKYIVAFDTQLTAESIYNHALNTQPQIKKNDIQQKVAKINMRIAEGARYPSVTAFAQLNSNYSSAYRNFVQNGVRDSGPIVIATIFDTIPIISRQYTPNFEERKVGLGTQFQNNFSQTIGLSINVPIFNNFQVRNNIRRARLNEKMAELTSEQAKMQLQQDIALAYNNVQNSIERIKSSTIVLQNAKKSLEYTKKRFEVGTSNSFDIITANNTVFRAENDLLQAQYEYVFRTKIIDFYIGKGIKL